ncbi:MAG: cytidylate kinase-like family protein [Acholeplasmatales bacterium]|nr:cytidylate kinase-like family protein [Acholeplasmatales bacterium]
MKDLIICIGRQYGSGGRFIGKLLAEKLNIPCYDKEILTESIKKSDINVDVIENNDEVPNSMMYSVFQSNGLSINEQVFLAQFDAIRDIANKGACVIVGRCADYILEDRDNVVSIFITAPIEERIKRATEFYKFDSNKALKAIKKVDKKRREYYNYYTNRKWGEASNYDLTLNSRIGVEKCVEVIVKYVESL